MADSDSELQISSACANKPSNKTETQGSSQSAKNRPVRNNNPGRQPKIPVKRVGKLGKLIFLNNLVFTILWVCCLLRLIALVPLVGRKFLPVAIAEFFQTLITSSYICLFVISNLNAIRNSHRRKRIGSSAFWLNSLKLLNGLFVTWVVIFHYPKVSKHFAYTIFIFCVSTIEAARHFSYLMPNSMTIYIKNFAFFTLFPCQKFSELVLILLSFKFNRRLKNQFIELNGDAEGLINWEQIIGVVLNIVAFAYLPTSCLVYYLKYKFD